jgi:hypothetical protein
MWEAFLDSLREDTELYNLTRQELENLVSVVVREKGFPKLVGSRFFHLVFFFLWAMNQEGLDAERLTDVPHQLEALDSMWVARGFIGR